MKPLVTCYDCGAREVPAGSICDDGHGEGWAWRLPAEGTDPPFKATHTCLNDDGTTTLVMTDMPANALRYPDEPWPVRLEMSWRWRLWQWLRGLRTGDAVTARARPASSRR